MGSLSVTAHLKVPIILGGGYLTLDAVLASLIFETTGDASANN
jgi:hypothetical protein